MTNPEPRAEALAPPTAAELAAMNLETMLSRWPETAAVFTHRQMGCVGCAVASFYTVGDAVNVYGLDEAAFVGELLEAIEAEVQSNVLTSAK